ncbi:MAG: type II secretion system protein [Patescibacteria group bacterium]
MKKNRTRGFTLIEMLVVLSIGAILLFMVSGAFSKATYREALDKQTAIIISLLEQARSQTLSTKDDQSYGVHFEATKAVIFSGTTYSASAPSNVVELVNPLVRISTITLAGGVSDILFQRLTGETSQSGTITLSLAASSTQTKTITVFATGLTQ